MSKLLHVSRRMLVALTPLALASSALCQLTWYVDVSAPAGGDGQSWASAWNDLQPALDAAGPDDQVWVAAGTYRPTALAQAADPRSARFLVPGKMKVFGGFHGTETSLEERDPDLFESTILSGDLGVQGDASDNSYHVVVTPSFNAPGVARLDGFRITAGNADVPGGAIQGRGGGVLCRLNGQGFSPQLTLVDCLLEDNHGDKGGAIASMDFGLVRLVRCTVQDNTAALDGAGAFSRTGGVHATNTKFLNNVCSNKGGAYFANSTGSSQVIFANCLFAGNAARRGGAVFLAGGQVTSGVGAWYQCTFTDNSATEEGGALWAATGTQIPARAVFYNSIAWGNVAPSVPDIRGDDLDIRSSNVAGGYPGAGNIDVDPQFSLLPGFTGRPAAGSPVNDAGDNALILADFLDVDGDGNKTEALPLDLRNGLRQLDDPVAADTGAGSAPIVDMGAYETHAFDALR